MLLFSFLLTFAYLFSFLLAVVLLQFLFFSSVNRMMKMQRNDTISGFRFLFLSFWQMYHVFQWRTHWISEETEARTLVRLCRTKTYPRTICSSNSTDHLACHLIVFCLALETCWTCSASAVDHLPSTLHSLVIDLSESFRSACILEI